MSTVRVFSQTTLAVGGAVEHTLVSRARSLFEADLSFERRHFSSGSSAEPSTASLTGTFRPRPSRRGAPATHGEVLTFSLQTRPTTAADVADAEVAERRGRAGGMALLAAKCGELWLVEVSDEDATKVEERPTWWLLLALLASVSLGPVLPSDGSTLLGVRSARERAEQAERRAEPSVEGGVQT
jgi:hypothetical protein